MSTTSSTQVFLYNEKPVAFQLENDGMVNATKLAKNFGKQKKPIFWLRTKAAQEYIEAYSTEVHICTSALTQSVKGGNSEQGTYMHPDIAIEYARWLNPIFGIWCNLRIKELLNDGYAISEEFKSQINVKIQQLYYAMGKMKDSYNALLERNKELEIIAPKNRASRKYLNTKTHSRTYTITSIARELGILPDELNDYLRRNRVQCKIDGFWELNSAYQGQGYAITKYGVNGYYEIDGSYYEVPYQYLVWTLKGKELILEMYELYE